MSKLPKYLAMFIKESSWMFAKTYARTWPHEYIVNRDYRVRSLILMLRLKIKDLTLYLSAGIAETGKVPDTSTLLLI